MSVNLYEQYDRIYRYCYFKVKNREIAEDLTQETFLKYFSQTSYINRGKELAYLYTIAKNLCIDYFRKKQYLSIDENLIKEDNIDVTITNLVIKEAIDTLPEDLKEIILLRFINELKINEISTFLGISRFAVYRRINSALKKLKLVLGEEDFYT